MKDLRKGTYVALAALPSLVGLTGWSAPAADTAAVDAPQLVRVPGKVHGLAQPRFDVGEAPNSLKLGTLEIVLAKTPAQQAALKQLLAAQQDPKSPEYHHFLTPAEYGVRFGASDATLSAVTQWLESNGFKVRPVAANRSQLYFSGTKAQVEAAFHTQIHLFDVNGERHFANVTVPEVPAGIAPLVADVQGLHDFYPRSTLRKHRLNRSAVPDTTYNGGQTNY